jgi:ubiquitin-protein ligase
MAATNDNSGCIIVLSDDDDGEPVSSKQRMTTETSRSVSDSRCADDVAIVLSDDDSFAPNGGPSTSSGHADKPIDLDGEQWTHPPSLAGLSSSMTAACGICGLSPPVKLYSLSGCVHGFCRACISRHVQSKLTEELASDVGCPCCKQQLTVMELQQLATNGAQKRADKRAAQEQALMLPNTIPGLPAWARQALLGGPQAGPNPLAKKPRPGVDTSRPKSVGTATATKRLMKEMAALQRLTDSGFSATLPNDSDLYTWDIELFGFEKGTALAQDLRKTSAKHVLLRVAFPSTFPASPPYIRVIRPRFMFHTGHVTIGGSICTEMLTSQGWSSTMTMESVIISIRTNMLEGGARIDIRNKQDYSEAEAREAFNRMMMQHGWF